MPIALAKLKSASARRKLPHNDGKPHWVTLRPNISLGYRANQTKAGTWSLRSTVNGAKDQWVRRLGLADDREPADGQHVLSYAQASEQAVKLARGITADDDTGGKDAPITVKQALADYEASLKRSGGDHYNAARARNHLSPALLSKPVALLTAHDLSAWLDSLVAKDLAGATINRTRTCLRAALSLAGRKDRSISNRHVWEELETVAEDGSKPRNVVIDDIDTVRRAVAAAYERGARFGMFFEISVVTGNRPGQIARLEVRDLIIDPSAPRLMMPKSRKGGKGRGKHIDRTKKAQERVPVPVPPDLALRLRQEAEGRAGDARLLLRDDGTPWHDKPHHQYRRDVQAVMAAVGLDPSEFTLYSARHSSITRMIKSGLPLRVIAEQHETSTQVIERVYSDRIARYSDAMVRAALPDLAPAPAEDNVVALADCRG